jgi:ABC-type phosphate transport system substrate-binding protein
MITTQAQFSTLSRFMATLLILLSPSLHAHADQGVLKLSISTSVNESLISKVKAPFEKETGIKIVEVESKARQPWSYLKDVMDDKSDGAVAAVSFEDWLKVMKDEKIDVTPTMNLTGRVVGRDLMHVIANKAVGVKALTLEQVGAIFTGKIKNWKNVGGADLKIEVLLSRDKKPTRTSFVKYATKGQPLTIEAKEVPLDDEMLKIIDTTPGTIAYNAYSNKLSNTVVIETPPIGRPITLATKGRPSPQTEALISFIRKNSQSLGLGN